MLKETSELLKEYYGLDDETFELSNEVMEDIKDQFDKIKVHPPLHKAGLKQQ